MIQKVKNKFMILASAFMLALPLSVPVAVSAADANIQGSLCKGAQDLEIANAPTNCEEPSASNRGFNALLTRIINILSVIIGVIAVIMIIFGGLRYITSGGDSTRVGNAKNTILYALIGLIIVALAQIIVRFVLSNTSGLAD